LQNAGCGGGRIVMRPRAWLLAAAALLALATAACSTTGATSTGGKVPVVVSFALFADFVQQVGGDRVEVTALVPPGVDPHTYQPVPKQVGKVERARLAVLNGLDLDRTVEDLVRANGSGRIVRLADAVPNADLIDNNPHLWLNPQYAIRYVEAIRDGLTAADPGGATDYERHASTYIATLQALDSEIAAQLATIPPQRRKLVTFHDAFPYLAQRYGFDIVGVVLKGPGREASASEVADLSRQLQSGGVPAVFKEPQLNARVLELAATDAGVKVLELYSDSFGDGVHTYVELMRFDAAQLLKGLQ